MKRFLKKTAITVIVAMLLAGCGSSNAAPAKEETAPEVTETAVEEAAPETTEAEEPASESTPEAESANKEAAESDTKSSEEAAEDGQTSSTEEVVAEESPRYVATFSTTYYILGNGEKQPAYETTFEYDDHANIIMRKRTDLAPEDGTTVKPDETTYEYEYNEKGKIVKTICREYNYSDLDGEKQLSKETTTEHDENGNIIHEVIVSFSYGDNSAGSEPEKRTSEFEYIYDGDQYTSSLIKEDGSTQLSEEGFVADGICYPTKSYNAYGEVALITQYDEYNNIISYEYVSSGYSDTKEIEYDEHHNPVSVTTINPEGRATTITERTFELIK